jgi:hypothetical protein
MARRGLDSTLIIGVGRDGDEFAAHAWVEHRGVPVLPTGGGQFERLHEL